MGLALKALGAVSFYGSGVRRPPFFLCEVWVFRGFQGFHSHQGRSPLGLLGSPGASGVGMCWKHAAFQCVRCSRSAFWLIPALFICPWHCSWIAQQQGLLASTAPFCAPGDWRHACTALHCVLGASLCHILQDKCNGCFRRCE